MSSGEKPKESIKANVNGWSELEELPEDGYVDSDIDKTTEEETPEEKQEKVSQAKAKVEESYRKSNVGESTSTGTEIVEDKSSSQEQLPSTAKRKLSKYDIAERSRVDRIKSDLFYYNIYEYERKQIASRPSTFTKTVRLIADKLGIKTKRSEERREREAMHVALSEYHEEEAARRKAIEEERESGMLKKPGEKRKLLKEIWQQLEMYLITVSVTDSKSKEFKK